ncbi:HNH endonuclease [Catellatospora vulcania]|uniref:HNH endonuclease n=1 Tax=Catellatospora vulcania TaxID=1460450 RepID=UPI0022A9BE64|nr:HNH endonuclease [Catellatospora vulcania]
MTLTRGARSTTMEISPLRENLFICFERMEGRPMRAAPGSLRSVPRSVCVFGHRLTPRNIVRWEGPPSARVAICGMCESVVMSAVDLGQPYEAGMWVYGTVPQSKGGPRRKSYNVNTEGCWIYEGKPRATDGYATVGNPFGMNTSMMAHRYFWTAWVGPVPADLRVDHLCRIRLCVNPAHFGWLPTRKTCVRLVPTGSRSHTA